MLFVRPTRGYGERHRVNLSFLLDASIKQGTFVRIVFMGGGGNREKYRTELLS